MQKKPPVITGNHPPAPIALAEDRLMFIAPHGIVPVPSPIKFRLTPATEDDGFLERRQVGDMGARGRSPSFAAIGHGVNLIQRRPLGWRENRGRGLFHRALALGCRPIRGEWVTRGT